MQSVLIIDFNDSFTENLARYFQLLGAECEIVTYTNIPRTISASHIVLSPGPLSPVDYPEAKVLLQKFIGKIPILGVCLGHQIICEYYGAKIVRTSKPSHGLAVKIRHNSEGLFKGMSSPLSVGCYNSLSVQALSSELICCAKNAQNEVMAVQHKKYAIFGVQFHPESVNTNKGLELLSKFLEYKSCDF